MSAPASRLALTGSGAAAYAMRQLDPDVVSAYPTAPQTEVVEQFSQYVADGLVRTEFVPVESEHSAMAASIGAAAAGARAITATASQGLAYLWEMLYIAAGMRLPIVMAVANRALSAPINIHGDQTDSMGASDSGWIQIYAESPQEVYDAMIQAVRIGEHPNVLLPVMVCFDGFVVSQSLGAVELLPDGAVRAFVGERRLGQTLLDLEHPSTMGPLALPDSFMEIKRGQEEAMARAEAVVRAVGLEYEEIAGRRQPVLEHHAMRDAEHVVIGLVSVTLTARAALTQLRAEGVPVGLVRIRAFRPFPRYDLRDTLTGRRSAIVIDRSVSPGAWNGPVALEVAGALEPLVHRPVLVNRVLGLGGRDVSPDDIVGIVRDGVAMAAGDRSVKRYAYAGTREGAAHAHAAR
ncbi:MAG: pyruvate ferredoxin oxidoreductase [Actinobacteria bacterium]|nr:pyruvate ferredoxin oxidoreductase [Actinomycetota bacterium]